MKIDNNKTSKEIVNINKIIKYDENKIKKLKKKIMRQ